MDSDLIFSFSEMDVKGNHQSSLSNYQIHLNSLLLQLLVEHALHAHTTPRLLSQHREVGLPLRGRM